MQITDYTKIAEVVLGLVVILVFLYWYYQKPIPKRKALASAVIIWATIDVLFNFGRLHGYPVSPTAIHVLGASIDLSALALLSIGGGLMIWARS